MMPELPPSLRHLVLDGSGAAADFEDDLLKLYPELNPQGLPPLGLRLHGLTRLETLSLLGCGAVRALEEQHLGPLKRSPLPPSLRTLRLEAPMAVQWRCESAPGVPHPADVTIEAVVGLIECYTDVGEDGAPCSAMPYGSAAQLVGAGVRRANSSLPTGVGTLYLEFTKIWVRRGPPAIKLRDVREDYTLQRLCELFRTAPGSYREVRLRSRGEYPSLTVGLAWTQNARLGCASTFFLPGKGMASLAHALRQSARANGIVVSLSSDEECCAISRTDSTDPAMLATQSDCSFVLWSHQCCTAAQLVAVLKACERFT